MTAPTPPSSTAARPRGREPGLAATVALYALARVGIVAVVAALLTLAGVPLLLGILIGLIVALPLSMVLFRGLRARLDRAIAARTASRGPVRDSGGAPLRGELVPDPAAAGSDRSADGEPDGGRG